MTAGSIPNDQDDTARVAMSSSSEALEQAEGDLAPGEPAPWRSY